MRRSVGIITFRHKWKTGLPLPFCLRSLYIRSYDKSESPLDQ